MEESSKTQYLAHVKPDPDGGWKEHPLEEHLQKASRLAGEFANHLEARSGQLWLDCGMTWENTQQAFRITSGQPAVMSTRGVIPVDPSFPRLAWTGLSISSEVHVQPGFAALIRIAAILAKRRSREIENGHH